MKEISREELQALIMMERATTKAMIKRAYREGMFKGLKKSQMNDIILRESWNESHAKLEIDEREDQTIPIVRNRDIHHDHR